MCKVEVYPGIHSTGIATRETSSISITHSTLASAIIRLSDSMDLTDLPSVHHSKTQLPSVVFTGDEV